MKGVNTDNMLSTGPGSHIKLFYMYNILITIIFVRIIFYKYSHEMYGVGDSQM